MLSSRLIDKLRCTQCRTGPLNFAGDYGTCLSCQRRYPVVEGRFPDFLTEADRRELEREMQFWKDLAAKTPHRPYADESDASYRKWNELLGAKAGEEVIELGCGSGAQLNRLPADFKAGLEPVAELLGPSQGFEGVIGTAHDLPFRDGSFDLVYFKHSLHHVRDKHQAFREAARITKPGGRLVIIEPNAAHPQRRLISSPDSFFRRSHVATRFIGPVETFQHAGELLAWGEELGLRSEQVLYAESHYDRLTPRQALQRVYSRVLGPVLPAAWIFPNYGIRFGK